MKKIRYCSDCGDAEVTDVLSTKCERCKLYTEEDMWRIHNRFKKNERVQTEFGIGIVVGFDLPWHPAWRWMVLITEPNGKKSHGYIAQRKPMAFRDKELSSL